ncbi:FecR domain-containing protein [Comamonas composti]|uniref:FecR domain-containing protein n=1 Tax=Comamonas composti TaxID=408558 RepID=UPI0005595F2D|nr:FecR domain-containing protein [Comamonas composti]
MSTEPIPPTVAREAVHWLLELGEASSASETQTQHTQQQWQAWLAADPQHARAWQRIAEVDAQLRGLPTPVALQTLTAPGMGRRHAVRLAVLLSAGTGGLLAAQHSDLGSYAWQQLAADWSTTTGQRREAVLADGTRVLLNTATAVDVRYTATERLIVLRAGEILVQSAPDHQPDAATGAPRPLRVRTAEGLVRALGTRFSVHQQDGRTAVAVLQGAVELLPAQYPQRSLRLDAGEQSHFTAQEVGTTQELQQASAAWSEGMLVADDMPLAEFLAELSRYRSGVLRCAPDAAQLRVSGSYPLADTDRVLAALTRSLPVDIHTRTRWWVTVVRRG